MSALKLVYTRNVVEVPLVFGKLVKIQHSPATVSAESLSKMPLFRRRDGKADGLDEAQVRRPAGGRELAQLSREELGMRYNVAAFAACCLFFSAGLFASQVKGTVTDPSGAPIGGAQISVVSRVGVEAQTVSAANGSVDLYIPDIANAGPGVTAPGVQHADARGRAHGCGAPRNRAASGFGAGGGLRHRCAGQHARRQREHRAK